MASKVPWIGLVHVRVAPGADPFRDGSIGAYVNVVAFVRDASEFGDVVRAYLSKDDLELVEIEDVDTVENYRAEDRISAEMDSTVRLLSEGNPVEYDVFAPYLWDDA